MLQGLLTNHQLQNLFVVNLPFFLNMDRQGNFIFRYSPVHSPWAVPELHELNEHWASYRVSLLLANFIRSWFIQPLLIDMMQNVMCGPLAVSCGTCPITKTCLYMWASIINASKYSLLFLQQLGTSLGYSVAQDTTENTSLLEISRFIENDIPSVIHTYGH